MWHVLEHVYDLKKDLGKIAKIIKDDGVLIVAVPNKNSFDANYYREHWAAYDVPIHLYHFTPTDIRKLFDEFGFQVDKILPMKFDAYYVSMLSEKYRGGNVLKAFLIGLKSNLRATNETYSSQIYILRPKTH
jgi:predicted SAM-dependent methyltransferase